MSREGREHVKGALGGGCDDVVGNKSDAKVEQEVRLGWRGRALDRSELTAQHFVVAPEKQMLLQVVAGHGLETLRDGFKGLGPHLGKLAGAGTCFRLDLMHGGEHALHGRSQRLLITLEGLLVLLERGDGGGQSLLSDPPGGIN